MREKSGQFEGKILLAHALSPMSRQPSFASPAQPPQQQQRCSCTAGIVTAISRWLSDTENVNPNRDGSTASLLPVTPLSGQERLDSLAGACDD